MSCLHLASPERQRPDGVNQINAFDDRGCTLLMDEMRKHEKKISFTDENVYEC